MSLSSKGQNTHYGDAHLVLHEEKMQGSVLSVLVATH